MPRSPARRRAPPPPLATLADLAAMPDPGSLPESQLQGLLLAHLNRIPGVWLWRANTGTAHAGDRWIRFGTPGQADLLGLVNGLFLAVEVKGPDGRQSDAQLEFQRRVVDVGGVYLLANDFRSTVRHVLELSQRTPRPLPF
jgi:hypothetical protein